MRLLITVLCLLFAVSVQARELQPCLELMQEPRLNDMAADTNVVAYRFIILPTWGNPIAIRIQQDGKVFKLWAKRLGGQGGYELGTLVEQKEHMLSPEESAGLSNAIKALAPLKMSAKENPDELGMDGADWTIEGVEHGIYKSINRWSPDLETQRRGLGRYVDFCSILVKKAGLREPPKNKGRDIFPTEGSTSKKQ